MAESIRSAAEIRARLEARYAKFLPHVKRGDEPMPDRKKDPSGYAQWRRSKRVVDKLFDDGELGTFMICERLAVPIHERLNHMVSTLERGDFIESPTNLKQTARAIRLVDDKISQLRRISIESANEDPATQARLIELRAMREEGGFSSTGVWECPSDDFKRRVDEEIESILSPDPIETGRLEVKKARYQKLLDHFKTGKKLE